MNVLDHGYVTKIEHWGSDERIIESARMSTNKGFQGWGDFIPCTECDGLTGTVFSHYDAQLKDTVHIACPACKGTAGTGTRGDERLLRYLYKNKHMTPFEMAGMTVEVQAPIFVFREWHRHRTQSYNELSARYTEIPELFYVPTRERVQAQSKKNKQGSDGELPEWAREMALHDIADVSRFAFGRYKALIDAGVARELARLVLPVNTYSRMRASANLRNWLGFLTLRLDEAAQFEIRQYAQAVADLVAEAFPRTFELFNA